MSRRYEGMDFGKVTVRLDEETDSVIQQYVDDHPGAKKSDAIRTALQLLGYYQQDVNDLFQTTLLLYECYDETRKIPGTQKERSWSAAMWVTVDRLLRTWTLVTGRVPGDERDK